MVGSSNSSVPGQHGDTAAPQADQPLVDQCPGGESNCRSQLEVAGPRWSQGLARESPGPPGILDGTWAHKIQSGKVSSGRSVISLLISLWIALPSFSRFVSHNVPACCSHAQTGCWGARTSFVSQRRSENGTSSQEAQNWWLSIPAFERSEKTSIIRSEENGTQYDPINPTVRDG